MLVVAAMRRIDTREKLERALRNAEARHKRRNDLIRKAYLQRVEEGRAQLAADRAKLFAELEVHIASKNAK